jgi:hypothetical protein
VVAAVGAGMRLEMCTQKSYERAGDTGALIRHENRFLMPARTSRVRCLNDASDLSYDKRHKFATLETKTH